MSASTEIVVRFRKEGSCLYERILAGRVLDLGKQTVQYRGQLSGLTDIAGIPSLA
jgi:hypothetical protein